MQTQGCTARVDPRRHADPGVAGSAAQEKMLQHVRERRDRDRVPSCSALSLRFTAGGRYRPRGAAQWLALADAPHRPPTLMMYALVLDMLGPRLQRLHLGLAHDVFDYADAVGVIHLTH